jgi:hypothetical protein
VTQGALDALGRHVARLDDRQLACTRALDRRAQA